ncbi:uncharacterized protein [Argopecten irradians]|uniref:uncharacterized protein n=1 Tax=Argopecten irradians TaxID=31199 RepID=UPI0037105D05
MKGQLLCVLGYLLPLTFFLRNTHAYNCYDRNNNCDTWARNGYCHSNSNVRNQCHLSCHLCSSSSASSTTTFTEATECLRDSYYNHLKSLTGNSCTSMDNQWYYLYHLTTSNHPHCARDAAKYLRDYYKVHHPGSHCTCSCQDIELTHTDQIQMINHCRNTDNNYKAIYDTTFYMGTSSSKHRMCVRHAEQWEKLAEVQDNSCFMELVQLFRDKFFSHNPDRRCTCGYSQGGSSVTTDHSNHQTDTCLQYPAYKDLNDLVEHDNCMSHYEVWGKLQNVSAHSAGCRGKIINKLNNAYGRFSHTPSNCTCNTHFDSLSIYHDPHGSLNHCMYQSSYKDLINKLGYSNHQTCTSHHTVWHTLNQIPHSSSSNYALCQKDAISHLSVSVSHVHNKCTCSAVSAGGSSGGTTQNHYTDSCLQYPAYKELNAIVDHDNCMSHYEVWDKLQNLSTSSVVCRIAIINKFNNAYGRFSHTPSNCTCSTNFEPLHIYNDPHGSLPHCMNQNNYHDLITRLGYSTHQNCSSHHTVWHDLAHIPHYTPNTYVQCQKDAISHLAVSLSHVKNKCSCSAVGASIASTNPSATLAPAAVSTTPVTSSPTQPTSTLALIPDVKMCNTLALTVGLAYGQVFKEGTLACSDGSHALSELTPIKLCNATDSSTWVKGQQVMTNCDSIPKYSAVAAYAGPLYTHDGLAGVLVDCNSTHLTVATEDCTHGLSLFYIPAAGRDTYVHSAHNYYTITW